MLDQSVFGFHSASNVDIVYYDDNVKKHWSEDAVCRGVNINVFFPVDDMSIHRWDEAYRYCRVCPVHMECLADALKIEAINDKSGMFGGLTPRERLMIRKGTPGFCKVFADGKVVGRDYV